MVVDGDGTITATRDANIFSCTVNLDSQKYRGLTILEKPNSVSKVSLRAESCRLKTCELLGFLFQS